MTKPVTQRLTPLAEDTAQPSYVRELIDAGRNARVSGYDFAQGLAVHAARVKSGAPMPDWAQSLQSTTSAGTTGAAAAGAGASLVGWVAVPVVIATIAIAGALSFRTEPEPARPAPAARIAAAASQPSTDAVAVAALPQQPELAAKNSAEAKPSSAVSIKPVRARVAVTKMVSPQRSAWQSGIPASREGQLKWTASGAKTSVEGVEPFAAAEPSSAAQQREARAESPAESTVEHPAAAARAAVDDARLEREMGMLSIAQRVLQSDPERALKLARQGEAEFRGSMFTQERQQVLLLALVKLGRLDEAKRLARPYLTRFPSGPFSDRVRRAVASAQAER